MPSATCKRFGLAVRLVTALKMQGNKVLLRQNIKKVSVGTHIEINGKCYDARTGQLLASGSIPPRAPAARPGRHTDGAARPVVSRNIHSAAQRSQTLMRQAVKKPAHAAPVKAINGKSMSGIAVPVRVSIGHVPRHQPGNQHREDRANKATRSELVSRFYGNSSVVPARPVTARVEVLPVAQAPAAAQHQGAAARPHSATASVISKGLHNAQSHNQPAASFAPARSRRRRLVSAAASGLAVLLLGAFITYQNIPNISMRYAASRAGISAKTPGYQPAGFSLNSKIKYTPGQITMSFSSNTDDREFTITQRESAWNSETLRNNYIAATNAPVHAFEDKGRTIYLYGDSSATWVNGGVWYDIKGDSQLNSDQLIRIATSL